MHLVELQNQLVVEGVLADEVGDLDGHVAFIIIKEFARIIWLEHLGYGHIYELTYDWAVLAKVFVKFVQEIVCENVVLLEKKGNHGFVTDVDEQSIALDFTCDWIFEVHNRGKVIHGSVVWSFFSQVVRTQDEPVEGLRNVGE